MIEQRLPFRLSLVGVAVLYAMAHWHQYQAIQIEGDE